MKTHKQWVCQVDKIPVDPIGHYNISIHDESKWLTHEEAKKTGLEVGFVLIKKGKYFCIDIDNCVDKGVPNQFANDILAMFPGIYAEFSRSGNGIHLFGSSKSFPSHKKRAKINGHDIELYSENRAINFTEAGAVGDYNKDFTVEFTQFVAKYMSLSFKKKPSKSSKVSSDAEFGDYSKPDPEWDGPTCDKELIKNALDAEQNAASKLIGKPSFRDFWENNEPVLVSAFPPSSTDKVYNRSVADWHFYIHLARLTGKDAPRMLRLAKKSGLARDKWDRDDYLMPSIIKVCDFVAGNKQNLNAETGEVVDLKTGIFDVDEIPIIEIKFSIEKANLYPICAKDIFEHGLHSRLIKMQGGLLWWSGREWQVFDKDTCAVYLQKVILAGLGGKCNPTVLRGISSFFDGFVPRKKPAEPNKRIFFKDKIFNLETNKTEDHHSDNLNLGTLAVNYVDNLKIPNWEKFMISMFGNLTDDRVGLMQEIFGWGLINHNLGIEKFIAFVGATRGGKGVSVKVFNAVLGDRLCNPIDFSNINSARSHQTLRRANVVIDFDAKKPAAQYRQEVAGTILKVSANESISSRILYTTDSINGPANCKIFIVCNKVPVLLDDSGAFAGRAVTLVFDKSFLGKEDFGLFDSLKAELAGIAHWMLQGLLRLIANNYRFTEPDSTKSYIADLKFSSQPLAEFLDQCIKFVPGTRCFKSDLFNSFNKYRVHSKAKELSSSQFFSAFKEITVDKGLVWKKIRIGKQTKMGVIGIEVKSLNYQEYQSESSEQVITVSKTEVQAEMELDELIPGGQAPNELIPGGQAPNELIPGGQAPNVPFPGGQVPNVPFPGRQAPNVPFPGRQAPNVPLFPGRQAPNGLIPGGQAPNGLIPGGQAPNIVNTSPVTNQPISETQELDAQGMIWNKEAHSSGMEKDLLGSWKMRKNITNADYDKYLKSIASEPQKDFSESGPVISSVMMKESQDLLGKCIQMFTYLEKMQMIIEYDKWKIILFDWVKKGATSIEEIQDEPALLHKLYQGLLDCADKLPTND